MFAFKAFLAISSFLLLAFQCTAFPLSHQSNSLLDLRVPLPETGLSHPLLTSKDKRSLTLKDRAFFPVPDIETIKSRLSVPPGTSLFYSRIGPGAPSYKPTAIAWRNANMPSLQILEESWTGSQTWTTDFGKNGNAAQVEKNQFWDNACEALAQLASGDVYVVLGPDVKAPLWGDESTVWARKEWPALQSNENVQRIIQVNPETNDQTVIWSN